VITLVTGGARAGKSRYALSLVEGEPSVTYIATAEALDEEMRSRIARHRAERPAAWGTLEASIDLAEAVSRAPERDALIVDCLTLWVSNLLLRATEQADGDEPWYPAREVNELVGALGRRRSAVIVVTNEVGLGVVPATPLGRAYRDALGRVNQEMARTAQRVMLLVAGIPVVVKTHPLAPYSGSAATQR
jgi:adenosylcobinamide kinase / adenosylcobinamide-phosphate guanylyltransferase